MHVPVGREAEKQCHPHGTEHTQCPALGFSALFSRKSKQGPLEKWLIPGLVRETHKTSCARNGEEGFDQRALPRRGRTAGCGAWARAQSSPINKTRSDGS